MPTAQTLTPLAVRRSLRRMGDYLITWRKLNHLTRAQVADRAGVSITTVANLEHGKGGTLENTLRVARSVGMLEPLTAALDPYNTDVGRLRSEEKLPQRVRPVRERRNPNVDYPDQPAQLGNETPHASRAEGDSHTPSEGGK